MAGGKTMLEDMLLVPVRTRWIMSSIGFAFGIALGVWIWT